MQAPANGFFYVLDRETGKLISAEKTGKVTWAERIDLTTGRPVEAPNIRFEKGDELTIWPSPVGSHNWQAMSFNPQTGLVYIPYMQAGVRYSKGPTRVGEVFIAGLNVGWAKQDEEDLTASLLAWDPVRQKPAWKVRLDSFWNGGTLTTAGNLVFQGTADGYFAAYDAASGKRLWRFNAGLGISGAPISYAISGRQYVSVLVGYGGSLVDRQQPHEHGLEVWRPAAQGAVVRARWKSGSGSIRPARHDGATGRRSVDQDQRGRCQGGAPAVSRLCALPWS